MEEFRLIKRTVVERADKARSEGAANANLVMVTSTREGEGKTFVALNLAFSLAADPDRSVMLIDGDPAKSSIAYLLGLEVEHGLTDLLQDGAVALEDVVLPTSVAGLSIVPSGHHHGLAAELFASERMGALLHRSTAPRVSAAAHARDAQAQPAEPEIRFADRGVAPSASFCRQRTRPPDRARPGIR